MQAAVIKSTIDVTRLMEQLHQQKQVRDEQFAYLNRSATTTSTEPAAKAPGHGEKLDTKG